jgi:hypothetical protein
VMQIIGSCVGHGHSQAMQYLQAVDIVLRGENDEYKALYTPYHYATGRNAPEAGTGRIRGPDGSLGSWQVKALTLYGVIEEGQPGLEPDGASVIRRWAVRMPERKWLELGKQHLLSTAAPVTTANEVRDAICNGYPVSICSDWGGQMRPAVKDGKLVNRRVTTWQHCMTVIGYDGSGREPYFYILNSWGPDAHGTPPDDAPPGGFWISKADMEYIVRQKDSYALSDFAGFPANDWDFALMRRKENRSMLAKGM